MAYGKPIPKRVMVMLDLDTQAKVVVEALRHYGNAQEATGNTEEAYLADEIRLELLKKMREEKARP